MAKFLITTATGRQGTSTARLLLAKGVEVNALVRDLASAASLALSQSMGAALFEGGFNDIPATTAVMQGINGVFLTGTPRSWTRLAWRARPRPYSPPHVLQAPLERGQSGLPLPLGAMRNWIVPGVANYFPEYMMLSCLLAVSYTRDFRLKQLDAVDVGQVAAAALLEPARFSGVELTLGHEGLPFDEFAAHLSEAIGREITLKYRTAEDTAEARKAMSMVEMQLWAPTVPRVEDAELDS
ncbi:hypothetical protein DFH07DRAFT_958576 [Mycena maculata]|uniref:NmrA-like domain-containing protein n=1 Tax=Mycena maculata TaxID=230809 RepID=A0AAD7J605_9AGAR|nr:hypothetical protein DFH07DRAFT_958576 [Mycena maculata]